jgi:general secretion pathway protein I
MSAAKARSRGFTLIEVMVALAILSVAVLAAFKLLRESTVALMGVRERVVADIIADNALIEAMTQPQPPAIAITRGTIDMAGELWAWRQTVAATSDPDLIRVDVTVGRSGSDDTLAAATGFRGVH